MYITSLRSPRRFCPKSLGSYGQWPKFWTLHSLLHCRSGLARVYPSPDQGGLPYYLRLAPSCTSCLGHLGWAIWSRAIIWKVLLSLEATPSDGIASHATFISRNLRRKRKTSAADSCRQISWQVSDIGDSLFWPLVCHLRLHDVKSGAPEDGREGQRHPWPDRCDLT